MNEVKYQITQLAFLVLLGLGAYWALTHLDSGVSYSRDQIIEETDLTERNPDQIVNSVVSENSTSEPKAEEKAPEVKTPEPTPESNIATPASSSSLVSDLQGLIDANTNLDSGDSGATVGVVQKFLEQYFKDRSISIDNDFGPTTKGLVREFQRTELNGGDGRVGPNTLRAMVEYLKN